MFACHPFLYYSKGRCVDIDSLFYKPDHDKGRYMRNLNPTSANRSGQSLMRVFAALLTLVGAFVIGTFALRGNASALAQLPPLAESPTGTVDIIQSQMPVVNPLVIGTPFEIQFRISNVSAAIQTVNSAALHFDFDPAVLEVANTVDGDGNTVFTYSKNSAFPTDLAIEFDNTNGRVNFVVGTLSLTPPTIAVGTSLRVVTITFIPKACSLSTTLSYVFSGVRDTIIAGPAGQLLRDAVDTSYVIPGAACAGATATTVPATATTVPATLTSSPTATATTVAATLTSSPTATATTIGATATTAPATATTAPATATTAPATPTIDPDPTATTLMATNTFTPVVATNTMVPGTPTATLSGADLTATATAGAGGGTVVPVPATATAGAPITGTCGLPIPSGSVVGAMPFGAQAYWAPGKLIQPNLLVNPGSYWVIGQDASETYYNILIACAFVWVRKDTMGPYSDGKNWFNNPLPTRVVS